MSEVYELEKGGEWRESKRKAEGILRYVEKKREVWARVGGQGEGGGGAWGVCVGKGRSEVCGEEF